MTMSDEFIQTFAPRERNDIWAVPIRFMKMIIRVQIQLQYFGVRRQHWAFATGMQNHCQSTRWQS